MQIPTHRSSTVRKNHFCCRKLQVNTIDKRIALVGGILFQESPKFKVMNRSMPFFLLAEGSEVARTV
jgi:hypothetical protein